MKSRDVPTAVPRPVVAGRAAWPAITRRGRGSACLPGLLLVAASLFFPTGCGRPVPPDVAEAFQHAQATFDHAAGPDDYLRAAAQYQAIVDRGVRSGAVFYNLGNAAMQAHQRGRAIAAYRQAQRYRPRDPYLEANLHYAFGSTDPGQRRPVVEQVFFWQNWTSYPEKFMLVGVTAAITFLLALATLFVRRRGLPRLALAAGLLTLVAGGSAAYDWYRYDVVEHGVTVQAETVARKGNSNSYEPALSAPLAEGTEFVVLQRRGDWLLVQLAAGQEGWIPATSAAVY
jgi:hypothetical protein